MADKKVVEAKKAAVRLMIVPSELRSYKGAGGKEYDQAALKAAGLVTSRIVAVPMFATSDFETPDTFAAAIPRVLGEWAHIKKQGFTHAKTTNAAVIEANGGSDEVELADATQGEPALSFLHDIIKSGISLAHQQTMGQDMRKAAEAKLGAPKASGGSKTRGLDA